MHVVPQHGCLQGCHTLRVPCFSLIILYCGRSSTLEECVQRVWGSISSHTSQLAAAVLYCNYLLAGNLSEKRVTVYAARGLWFQYQAGCAAFLIRIQRVGQPFWLVIVSRFILALPTTIISISLVLEVSFETRWEEEEERQHILYIILNIYNLQFHYSCKLLINFIMQLFPFFYLRSLVAF